MIKRNMTKTVSDNVKFTTAPTANRNRENENVFCRCRSVTGQATVSIQAYWWDNDQGYSVLLLGLASLVDDWMLPYCQMVVAWWDNQENDVKSSQ